MKDSLTPIETAGKLILISMQLLWIYTVLPRRVSALVSQQYSHTGRLLVVRENFV